MTHNGNQDLRRRGPSGKWRPSGDDAVSAPRAQSKAALSAPLLSDESEEEFVSDRVPLLGGDDDPVFKSNKAERRSYLGLKWRSDEELDSPAETDSKRSSSTAAHDDTTGTKLKKNAFTAACAVLDVFPSGFSVKLFAPELTHKEINRLHQYEATRLVPFDRTRAPHREALSMLWYNCHSAKPLHSVALGQKPSTMPRETVASDEVGGALVRDGKEFVSEEWKEFGFQGVDPATDFRGGGVFSLYNLVAFSNSYPYMFSKILQEADYPVAVAGINLSMMVLHILGLTKGKVTCLATTQLKHCYTAACARTKMGRLVLKQASASFSADVDVEIERVLHEIYVVAFGIMHQIWMKRPQPRNIMEFNSTFPKVRERLDVLLRSAESLEQVLSHCPYDLQ